MRKLRVLLITSMPWRDDNNIGNSYSNLFNGLENEIEFAHIYCRSGMPQNKLCHKYFQIDESDLIANIFKKKDLGRSFYLEDSYSTPKENFTSAYNKARMLRWEIFFAARNVLWMLADWRNVRLDSFVEDFNPDVIFGTLTYMPNINIMMKYLHDKYNIPLVLYSWDDVYSLKQKSYSPIFWLRRLHQRCHIKKCVKRCDMMFTITTEMQNEYHQYFGKRCEILTKSYDFNQPYQPWVKNINDGIIHFVYLGNIGAGRWKALAELSETLFKIYQDRNEVLADLKIYTTSPISKKMKVELNRGNVSMIMEPVPYSKVSEIQKSADILVHVEPIDEKDRLTNRLSFSTKLVDYFQSGRCILAIGGRTASINYLEREDAAIVVGNKMDLSEVVSKMIQDDTIIRDYAKKAWDCGVRNHRSETNKKKLVAELRKAAGNLII